MPSIINLKSFPRPRQHGAWIMFLVPAIMGILVDVSFFWMDLVLLTAFVLVFFSYQPFQRFLRRRLLRKVFDREALAWSFVLGGGGFVLITALFILYQRWYGFLFGIVILIFLFLHLLLAIRTSTLALPVELVGVAGLTAAAPMMILFNTGTIGAVGWVLWLVNFLYFSGSLFFVKLKLRVQPGMAEPSTGEKIKQGVPLLSYTAATYMILFLMVWIQSSLKLLLAAFLPFLIKAIIGVFSWYDKQLARPGRTGFYEILHAVTFMIITLIALRPLS